MDGHIARRVIKSTRIGAIVTIVKTGGGSRPKSLSKTNKSRNRKRRRIL